jgi:hypothetical protein
MQIATESDITCTTSIITNNRIYPEADFAAESATVCDDDVIVFHPAVQLEAPATH